MRKDENGKYINQWVKNAQAVEADGGTVNWKERYYKCPLCGAAIYEDEVDPELLEDYICPRCEDYEEEDEDWDEEFEDEDEDEDMGGNLADSILDLVKRAMQIPGCEGVGIIIM